MTDGELELKMEKLTLKIRKLELKAQKLELEAQNMTDNKDDNTELFDITIGKLHCAQKEKELYNKNLVARRAPARSQPAEAAHQG